MQTTITNRKGEKFIVQYDEQDKELIDGGIYIHVKEKYYAVNVFKKNKVNNTTILARIIMNVTDPKIFIDHIDRNPLNNRRSNLRTCTAKQNTANIIKPSYTNEYPNVLENTENKCFIVTLQNDKKTFDNNYDAIIYVYNSHKATKGEFNPEKRTLVEIAEQVPYKTYNRVVQDPLNGNKCPVCEKIIFTRFNEHVGICTNLKCLKCDAEFADQGKLNRHIEENCSDKECVRCGLLFKNIKEFREHVEYCEYTCEKCNYHTSHQSNLLRHMRDYHATEENDGIDFYRTELKIFQCKFCETKSETLAGLQTHESRFHREIKDKINQESKKFECDTCHLKYTTKKCLSQHIKRMHT